MTDIIVDFNVEDSTVSLDLLLERLGDSWTTSELLNLNLENCPYLGPMAVLVFCALQERRTLLGLRTEMLLPKKPPLAGYCRFAGLAERFHAGPCPDAAHPKNETLPISNFRSFDSKPLNGVASLVRRHMDLGRGAEEALKTSLSEVMYNVVDHADSPMGGLLTARAYANQREVRVAVADIGVGVLTTLSRTHPRLVQHEDALREALRGDSSARSTPRNLGQGLKTLDSIVRRNGGQFLIATYDAVYARRAESAQVEALQRPFPGTLVTLRFRVDNELYSSDIDDNDVW